MIPVWTSTLFLLLVGAAALAGLLPAAVLVLYLAASGATFLVYARDKRAATAGKKRTAERTLHLLALAGGWPGALLAQRLLRHKTRKQPFRSVYRATVLANCAALVLLIFLALQRGS
jgi:uncharacterized membrane protein YsdA (DUF1294 family)